MDILLDIPQFQILLVSFKTISLKFKVLHRNCISLPSIEKIDFEKISFS